MRLLTRQMAVEDNWDGIQGRRHRARISHQCWVGIGVILPRHNGRREQVGEWNNIYYRRRDGDKDEPETTTLWKRERSSEGGKIKGLDSYGNMGVQVATQANGTEGDQRRQKVSTRVHAGQLGKGCRTYGRRHLKRDSQKHFCDATRDATAAKPGNPQIAAISCHMQLPHLSHRRS